MLNKYDVIISGAGPSGSLLGYYLADKGISTLIIEKEIFPRQKVCAGGIQYRAYKLLPFEIGDLVERKISSICFSIKNKDFFRKKYEKPFIFTINRAAFDNLLLEKASGAGCTKRLGERVTGYSVEENLVEVQTDKGKYRSRIVVGADGVTGKIHRSLMPSRDYHKIIGYESEVELSYYGKDDRMKEDWYENSIRLDFSGVKKGYGWLFPKEKRASFGVGGPYRNASALKKYYYSFYNDIFSKKAHGHALKAFIIPVRKEDTPFKDRRVLAIGDAACLADGFTGEGLYNAFRSSFIASKGITRALDRSDFSFDYYADEMEKEVFRDINISLRFSRRFYSTPFFFYKLLKYNDRFFRLCCKVLRGEVRFKDISERLKFIRY